MEPTALLSLESIPNELRQLPQWVCWRYEKRKGKRTKIPYCAHNGRQASATDPKTWCSFDAAVNVTDRDGIYDGIGFVLSESDPYCGIDIDDCLDEQGNFVWGQDVVHAFDTYTEISPSGRGVKLFLLGRKPPGARSRAKGTGTERRQVAGSLRQVPLLHGDWTRARRRPARHPPTGKRPSNRSARAGGPAATQSLHTSNWRRPTGAEPDAWRRCCG